MLTVINESGKPVDFDIAILLMDDELKKLTASVGFDTEQEFFTYYEALHRKKFGVQWEQSTPNPIC